MTPAALQPQPAPLPPLAAGEPTPFVVVGCPIRQREWVVERHVDGLAQQNDAVSPGRTHGALGAAVYLVEGVPGDETLEALRWVALLRRYDFRIEVLAETTGNPHWSRSLKGQRYTGDKHAHLARVYNRILEEALAWGGGRATHVWMLDSDVIPDPDVLRLLLAADKDVCAAVARNSPGALNFMLGERDGEPRRDGAEEGWMRLVGSTPFPATFVSACVLYRREVLEAGCRFAPDPRSHDFGMAAALRAAGYRAWVEPRARCSHFYGGPAAPPLRP